MKHWAARHWLCKWKGIWLEAWDSGDPLCATPGVPCVRSWGVVNRRCERGEEVSQAVVDGCIARQAKSSFQTLWIFHKGDPPAASFLDWLRSRKSCFYRAPTLTERDGGHILDLKGDGREACDPSLNRGASGKHCGQRWHNQWQHLQGKVKKVRPSWLPLEHIRKHFKLVCTWQDDIHDLLVRLNLARGSLLLGCCFLEKADANRSDVFKWAECHGHGLLHPDV